MTGIKMLSKQRFWSLKEISSCSQNGVNRSSVRGGGNHFDFLFLYCIQLSSKARFVFQFCSQKYPNGSFTGCKRSVKLK